MGVDTRLYLNTRWGIDDIVAVIERTQNTKVEIVSHHDFAPGYFNLCFNERMMHLHSYNQTPIGTATLLSLSANDEAHKIFRDIAGVLGGVFMESDSEGNCEIIEGAMCEEDGLPYFVKYAIVKDGIDAMDVDAFLASKKEWHKRIGS